MTTAVFVLSTGPCTLDTEPGVAGVCSRRRPGCWPVGHRATSGVCAGQTDARGARRIQGSALPCGETLSSIPLPVLHVSRPRLLPRRGAFMASVRVAWTAATKTTSPTVASTTLRYCSWNRMPFRRPRRREPSMSKLKRRSPCRSRPQVSHGPMPILQLPTSPSIIHSPPNCTVASRANTEM